MAEVDNRVERAGKGEICACDNAMIAQATGSEEADGYQPLSDKYFRQTQARRLCEASKEADCQKLGYCALAEKLVKRATGAAVIPDDLSEEDITL